MSAIIELLQQIKSLKPIPAVVNQILEAAEDPNSSMEDIAKVILYDPSTTATVLKMCNSAYFGLPTKIDSVHDAVTLLGIDQVVDMVLLKAGAANFTNDQSGYGLNEGELWTHAVSSALIARHLAEKTETKNTHQIFTAALIKDIGKVILDRFVGEAFGRINHLVETMDMSFKEAEKNVIGIDHAEIGGIVAKMWDFSFDMQFIIKNHHMESDSARDHTETKIVYVADSICMMMGIGGGADGLAYRLDREALTSLGVTQQDVQGIMAGFSENMEKVDSLLQLI